MISKIQERAEDLAENLVVNDNHIIVLKDGAPPWCVDVLRHAHGTMMPDDHRYQMIDLVLTSILENDDDDYDDLASQQEAPPYTTDRYAWLTSRLDRSEYVDEAINNFGWDAFSDVGIVEAIGAGWEFEYREVFRLVVEALTNLDSDEDENDVDSTD